MAGIPPAGGDEKARRQAVLDFMCDNIGQSMTADEIADGTGLPVDQVKVEAEALAYQRELAKERTDGGQAIYRRNA